MKIRVQFRRATAAAWANSNIILAAGEIGFETNTSKIKFGDGVLTWNQLPYANLSSIGTLTSVTAGEGLLGGTITNNGTIAIDKNFVATLDDTQTIANKTFGATLEYLTPIITDTASADINIDLSQGPDYYIFLNNSIGTVNFLNLPVYNKYAYFTLIIRNGGNYAINWPTNVHWQDGTTPNLSSIGKEDIFYISTVDGGTTFFATTLGAGYFNPNNPITQTGKFRIASQYRYGFKSTISGDGRYAAVSSENSSNIRSNVYIYAYDGNIWRQQAVLSGSSTTNAVNFGASLSLNFDGSVLLVGDPGDLTEGPNSGKARIFTRISGGAWAESSILAVSDPKRDAQVGYSVALNDAGDIALVGAPATTGLNGVGSIYVFTKSGGFWSQSAKLNQPGNVQNTAFGFAVATDSIGTFACIGAPRSNQAHVYNKSGTNWIRQASLFPSNAPTQSRFGNSVTISGDSNFCIVGDPAGGVGGYVVVFGKSGTNWLQTQIIEEPHPNIGNSFGQALRLNSDGQRVYITAENSNNSTGKAYVYLRAGLAFEYELDFTPADSAEGIKFGSSGSMSANGLQFITSAPDANAAYFFQK